MRTRKEIEADIQRQEDLMFVRECSDDFYHLYGSYQEDQKKLDELKRELKNTKE